MNRANTVGIKFWKDLFWKFISVYQLFFLNKKILRKMYLVEWYFEGT